MKGNRIECRFYQLSYNFCIKTEERIHFRSLRPVSDKYQITFPSPCANGKLKANSAEHCVRPRKRKNRNLCNNIYSAIRSKCKICVRKMPFTLDGRIKGKQNGKISIEMTVANISLYIKKNDMAPLFSRSHLLMRSPMPDRFAGGRSSRDFSSRGF